MKEKRLVKSLRVVKETPRLVKNEDVAYIKATQQVLFKADLPKAIKKKLLSVPPKILSANLHYVSCWKVTMHFQIEYLSGRRNASGELEFIVDPIKGSCVNEERLDLKLKKIKIDPEMISEKKFELEEAERKSVTDARWKVLLNRYKQPAKITIIKTEEFFRPYYVVEVIFGTKKELQYVIADEFSNYFTYSS